MAVVVRRLGQQDVPLLRAVNLLFADVFDDRESYLAAPPSDDASRAVLARDEVIVLAAQDGRAVVGAAAAYVLHKFEQDRREIYLYDLAVAHDRRRQGIAATLIGDLRRIGREIGAWTIFVQADIVPEDEPARALYRRMANAEITALHFDIAP